MLRLLGIGVLGILLWQVDAPDLTRLLRQAQWSIVAVAFFLNIPHILLKSQRWLLLLRAQGIRYRWVSAYLVYYSSIFVGLLTPGRLGEFIKALHVSKDCNVSTKRAFTSVLVDRLFDLYALAVVGGLALVALGSLDAKALTFSLLGIAVALLFPPALVWNRASFVAAQRRGARLGKLGRALLGEDGWATEVHRGLRELSITSILVALLFTIVAYTIFYVQTFLLALSLNLDASLPVISFAVALGSLVTLLPVSISGLGTREAAVVAYLGSSGVSAEAALGFSLLVFAVFYLGGAIIGSVAWMIKPAQWGKAKRIRIAQIREIANLPDMGHNDPRSAADSLLRDHDHAP
ncbi:MAG: flippase-like domain-containing protein [Chloroflexi bacterium]|nr:flippase-like domain-containing protein [Chloroflexota bacterium]